MCLCILFLRLLCRALKSSSLNSLSCACVRFFGPLFVCLSTRNGGGCLCVCARYCCSHPGEKKLHHLREASRHAEVHQCPLLFRKISVYVCPHGSSSLQSAQEQLTVFVSMSCVSLCVSLNIYICIYMLVSIFVIASIGDSGSSELPRGV